MRTFLLFMLCLFTGLSAHAQQYFTALDAQQFSLPEGGNQHVMMARLPEKIWALDRSALQAKLATAPWENSKAAQQKTCVIAFPLADGRTKEFAVEEIAMLDAGLAAQFPEIHTYAGKSVDGSGIGLRFSVTYRGFRAMVLHPDMNVEYIEPVAWEVPDQSYFIAYDRRSLPAEARAQAAPSVTEALQSEKSARYAPEWEGYKGQALAGNVKLRTIRLTVATTGEFGQDHGGTKPLVLSAVTEYSNMVSTFFERDAQLRLQLMPCTESVIYTNPATDPFVGSLVTDWMSQNDNAVTFYCGPGSHDIGHVYARYLGGPAIGVAGGTACTPTEDRGCSAGNGQGNYGDNFLNTLGQELGHQLSAGHTWNRCGGGGGRAGNSAFEPGSGSTIMSYAGACGSDNVQGYSDLYFHSGSVDEFLFFFEFGIGPDCGVLSETENNHPVVTLPYSDNFFIPIKTPFELNGSATDADGDALSYAWEEMDTGPETELQTPQGSAPIFRVWPAGNATNRVFPRMNSVLNGTSDVVEQLPTYTRDMTFRLFVRDNKPNGGGTGKADVAFKAWGDAGPFLVKTAQTNNTSWQVGELVEVLWDVAGTNIAPVNCQKVNIRLSLDNGQTWPILLAEGAGNDGRQYVMVPNEVGNNARLRIDAADNVFFAVSKFKFSIKEPTQGSVTFGLGTDEAKLCLPSDFQTEILTAATLGFSTSVALSIDGTLPPGAVANFSSANISAGQSATLFIDMSQVTEEGTYTFNVKGTPATGSLPLLRPVTITTQSNNFDALKLNTPVDGTTGANLIQTLRWSKAGDADTYDVQISENPAFTTILAELKGTNLDSFKMNILLGKGKAYYWRVRPQNECGTHAWTEPFFFSTFAEDCQTFTAGDTPKNISASSINTQESKITLPFGGTVSDVNVAKVKGFHGSLKDLEVTLISPDSTEVLLFKNKCGSFNGYFDLGFDDAAAITMGCPPPNSGASVRPAAPLLPLVGASASGVWKLRVKDQTVGSGGVISDFRLEICASLEVVAPTVGKNAAMPVEIATNKAITNEYLRIDDANTAATGLTYTLLTVPAKGELRGPWDNTYKAGDSFTQANIDAGQIRYYHYGTDLQTDHFRFVVSDGGGGFLGTTRFDIDPYVVVATTEASGKPAPMFSLLPNPAASQTWITLPAPSEQQYRLKVFNTVGQLMSQVEIPQGTLRQAVDVQDWPSGAYFFQLEGLGGRTVKRFIR